MASGALKFTLAVEAADRTHPLVSAAAALAACHFALARGDYERAVSTANELLAVARQLRIRLFASDTLYYRGKALMEIGRIDEALASLAEARAEAEALGSCRTLWQILAALSPIEAARGDNAEAASLRRQAQEIVEHIADHAGSDELRESFLNMADVRQVMPMGDFR
ncbi:MAG: hypothetical protein HY260_14535 [Chloroflexi bacterium]|nr:hypothetical protein [Chloroflexota bacterium]